MRRFLLGLLLAGVAGGPFKIGARAAEPEPILNWNPLRLPEPGETRLRVLSPTILELFTVFAHPPETDVPPVWQDLSRGKERPAASLFHAQAEGRRFEVKRVGFRRRAIYAPLKNYDLRVGRSIYLQLAEPLPPSGTVALSGPGPVEGAQCRYGPERWSPAIHVNQVGYAPEAPKQAQVGGFLGDLGELSIPEYRFNLIDEADGSAVFHGILQRRFEKGFRFPCYEKVFAADFSEFRKPGVYRLEVPGLGRSLPFRIDEGAVAAFARTYALGFYHQRCGDVNELPFTRFTHAPCHSKPAEVPTDAPEFQAVEGALAGMTSDVVRDKNHHTERLNKIANALFPFIRPGPVDVSGGHHDAGDYGKYTINSAQLIHYLVFAADAFPGAGGLDNLGLPESGDGKSDLLQIAKREADFLAKMQDKDGAFYFLVYPR
ncbi:MAG: glycoside hydrolase family 9 protein, partial [Verrucomicrobiae bacterium]|nr:glycoside hydrolase family 9 protein [Verrucomicrobiae bacterium]